MNINFQPVPLKPVTDGRLGYARPQQMLAKHVHPQNPAVDVMTDLRQTTAVTISPFSSIDDALQTMIHRGVRLLLVEDHEGLVMGLITASDIQGEKPMRFSQETITRHDDILVRDVMTRVTDIEVMTLNDARHNRVGDIVKTLTQTGRQHALVMEENETNDHSLIRGIFSTTQISKQLGMPIHPSEKAQSFADLEMAIAS